MFFELIEDIVKLSIIIACLYFSLSTYVHSQHPSWSEPLEKRRFTILLGLIMAVIAIKIREDVCLTNKDRSRASRDLITCWTSPVDVFL